MNKLKKSKIYVHADDFGWNDNISSDISECIKTNTLNSLSIIVNSPNFKDNFLKYRNNFNHNNNRAEK